MAKMMKAAVNGQDEKKAKVANMGACIASKLKDAKHMPASKCPCTLAKLANASQAHEVGKKAGTEIKKKIEKGKKQPASQVQTDNELDDGNNPGLQSLLDHAKKAGAQCPLG